ncbi:MAG: VCBS repeat-containing protein [Myxococcales bacterium]|nr:VCBS repeat-containing protein [Myxococcales bacterium]
MRSPLTMVVLVAGGCNAVFGLDPVTVEDAPPAANLRFDLEAAPAALVAGALSPSGPIELVVTTGTNVVVVLHNRTAVAGAPIFAPERLVFAVGRQFDAAALVEPTPGAAPVLATVAADGTLYRIDSTGAALTATDQGLAVASPGDVVLGGEYTAGAGVALIGTPGGKAVRAIEVATSNELLGATLAKNLRAWVPADLDRAPPIDAMVAVDGAVLALRLTTITAGNSVIAAEVGGATNLGPPLAAGDLDGDGDDDVVGVDAGTALVEAFLTTTTELQHGESDGLDLGVTPSFLAIGDVDGDGRGDLVAAAPGASASTTLVVAYGDGRGRFAPGAPLALPGLARGLVVVDLDHDGRDDVGLAVAGPGGAPGAIHLVFPR